jgi:hypothetical protein
MQQEINIAIGAKSPDVYFRQLKDQCAGGKMKYGAIDSWEELQQNLKTHCIPELIFESNIDGYDAFLSERRVLMAEKIRAYYHSL